MTNILKVALMLMEKGEISQNITTQINLKLGRQLSATISSLRKKGMEIYTTKGSYDYTEDVVYVLVENPENDSIIEKLKEDSIKSVIPLAKRKVTNESKEKGNKNK